MPPKVHHQNNLNNCQISGISWHFTASFLLTWRQMLLIDLSPHTHQSPYWISIFGWLLLDKTGHWRFSNTTNVTVDLKIIRPPQLYPPFCQAFTALLIFIFITFWNAFMQKFTHGGIKENKSNINMHVLIVFCWLYSLSLFDPIYPF